MILAHLGGIDEIGVFGESVVGSKGIKSWAGYRYKQARSWACWSSEVSFLGTEHVLYCEPCMREQTRTPADIGEDVWERAVGIDSKVIRLLRRHSLMLLRISLAVVFVWFGVLKIFGVTPVTDLVTAVVYWVDPSWFVPVLGVFEVFVGLGLLVGVGMRLVLLLLVAQLVGTFLVLLVRPDLAFQGGNPLLLTTEGEFVVKNLVLISAGLAVGSQVPSLPNWRTPSRSAARLSKRASSTDR